MVKKIFDLSAYEVKNNCYLFERLFKVKKNGVLFFGISLLFLGIFTVFYYANEESEHSRISPEILEQCSLNLAPELYITK